MTTTVQETVVYTEEGAAKTPRLETVYNKTGHQRQQALRRRTFRQLLTQAEGSVVTNALDPATTTPFSGNATFQRMLKVEGGFHGTLTEAGFNYIRHQAIKEVGAAVDLSGYPCEAVLATGKWGALLMLIVRLYALTFGQAHCIKELNYHSKLCIKEESRVLASQMVMQLTAPEQTQKGVPMSLVQRVVLENMDVGLLTGYIKMGIKNLISNYMNGVKRGTTLNRLKQVLLLEDHPKAAPGTGQTPATGTGGGGYAIAEHHDPAIGMASTSSAGYMVEMLCRAFRDLSPKHKEVMRAWLTCEEKSTWRPQITFAGQLVKVLGRSKDGRRRLADEIVASIRNTLGVTLHTKTITVLKASEATMSRIRKDQVGEAGMFADWKPVMVSDTTFESPFVEQEIYLIDLMHQFYKGNIPTKQFMEALN